MRSKRNIYLKTVSIPEAVSKALGALDRESLMDVEVIPSEHSAGRVTAGPVYARYSSPTYHSAAMDGIAVNAEKTFSAREGSPARLEPGKDFEFVNTGYPLPVGRDAVIMIEHVVTGEDGWAEIESPAYPWQHVRRIGEDIVATELLIPQNHALTSYDVGALLSAGIWEVAVHERVRIDFIPTGDEILDYTLRPVPKPGQVVESNSQILASMARSWGCAFSRRPPVPDDPDALGRALDEALENDSHIVVIGAGSSAGSKDFTRTIIEQRGEVLVHGISAMPGKPTIIGVVGGKPVVGAPGYPVSSVVCFERILMPLVHWLIRKTPPQRPVIEVELTRKAPSKLGMEEFVRLAVGRVGDRWMGAPLARGAGMITTMTKAGAVARIPANSEGVNEGEKVEAELIIPESEVQRVLVVIGSHDNTLDLIANELMGMARPISLCSTHAGSMGGLRAVGGGSCHLAGSHLFDPKTGDYNFPFIEKILPGKNVVLINLAVRHQGLITGKGNPKKIEGVGDLIRPDITYINRQRGAGTRILLDHHLRQANIDPLVINGYDNEEYTHMAVAVNVLTGAADTGLGIYAAAKALDLDFVPLARERYDLVIPAEFMDEPRVATLLDLINTDSFKAKIEAQGGYETRLTGQVMKPGMGLG